MAGANHSRVRGTLALLAGLFFASSAGWAAAPLPVARPEDASKFYAFLHDFRDDALKAGVRADIYDHATAGISLNTHVQDLNEKQPEFVRPVWEYLEGAVSETRVTKGKDLLAANADLFATLETTYGIPREVLTAIWGMESGFGQNQGNYNLFEALATLSYDGPRKDYGRREMIAALKIAQTDNRDPATMLGSWAGAMGQTQFVPSTFLQYAVDGDGDGMRDVWNSPADALASAANYLNRSGWRMGEPWGEEVQLPPNFAFENADPDVRKSQSEWAAMGVRDGVGNALPATDDRGWIFLPAGARGPAFLARANFDVILKYNFATSYALAVGLLSDRLRDREGVLGGWPRDEVPLEPDSRVALQTGLEALGYMTGGADGVLGRRTRQALRDYQKARGLPADGFPTASLLTRILNEMALKH